MLKRGIAVLLLGSAAVWAQSNDTPLGDVVRQNRPTKKAKRVITNDDIPSRPPENATMQASAAATAASEKEAVSKPAATDKIAVPPGVEDRIAELKGNEVAQERVIKKFEDGLREEGLSDFRREMYENGLKKSKEMLEGYSRQREALEQAVADLKKQVEEKKKQDEEKKQEGSSETSDQPPASSEPAKS